MTEPDKDPLDWQQQGNVPEKIEIDHPLFKKAPHVSIALGGMAAVAVLFGSETPWWMPLMIGGIVAGIVFRILRPRMRHPSIEDEI